MRSLILSIHRSYKKKNSDGKLVRLWRGVWNKENNGAGNFHLDPTYFGFGEITRDKETFEPLMSIVRMRYVLGERTLVVLS